MLGGLPVWWHNNNKTKPKRERGGRGGRQGEMIRPGEEGGGQSHFWPGTRFDSNYAWLTSFRALKQVTHHMLHSMGRLWGHVHAHADVTLPSATADER